MALTDAQKHRISFHLNFVKPNSLLAIDKFFTVNQLDANQEISLVGFNLSNQPPEAVILFGAETLCTRVSLLGKVELAFEKLSPEVVDDSLFVSKAGSVNLRGNELLNRRNLYEQLVEYMGQLIGSKENSARIGYGH